MAHDSIDSLSEFLLHAGTEYRVFDMGRGITPVAAQSFLDIENGILPCPQPRQKKAWYGLVFWQAAHGQTPDANHQYIWFVSLPLDEESRVVAASRNHFLQLVVEALQADPKLTKGLPDNPYIFTPSETQRGQFSAWVQYSLGSTTYDTVSDIIAYIKAPGAMDWQQLVAQHIYTCAHVINQDEQLSRHIAANWALFAPSFQRILLAALETVELNSALQSAFTQLCRNSMDNADRLNYLRVLNSHNKQLETQALLAELLSQLDRIDMDLLSVVAARHWTQFTPGLLRVFLSSCALIDEKETKNGELFAGFYTDIVAVPSLRQDAIRALKTLNGGLS